MRTLPTSNGAGRRIAFSPDGSRIATGLPVVLRDPAGADPSAVEQKSRASEVTFSPDGRLIGAVGEEGATIWERRGDEVSEAAKLAGTEASARQGIAFSPDSRHAVTYGEGGLRLQIWDLADPGSPRLAHVVSTESDPVTAVLFGPGRHLVVTGHSSGTISVWDTDGNRVASIGAHRGAVRGLALHPDGRSLASSGEDGAVTMWDVSDPTRLVEISRLRQTGPFETAHLAFSPDGTMLGGAYSGGTIVWNVEVPRLVARLCAESRPFSETEWRQYLPDLAYDPPCPKITSVPPSHGSAGVVTTSPAGVTSSSLGPAPDDLHGVDWDQATVTGAFCGVEGPVRLRDGRAEATSTLWGKVFLWTSRPAQVRYGDLDGDGRDEAAVTLGCDDGSGATPWKLALGYGIVVVRSVGGSSELVGEISATTMRDDAPHIPSLTEPRLEKGVITVEELWYRPSDGDCCPSAASLTRWWLRDGTLKADPPVQVS